MNNMFEGYDNLNQNYIPNNLNEAFPKKIKCQKICETRPNKPYDMYNELGQFIGYFWYYGNTLSLDFDITGEYTVESDAIISYNPGEYPTSSYVGKIGQYFYNIPDETIWECVAIDNLTYTWTLIENKEEALIPNKAVYIDPEDYLTGKTLYFTIYNFRGEEIYKKTLEASRQFIITIDEELSKQMVRGNYTVNLVLYDDKSNSYETLFDDEDAIFTVK